MVAGAAVEAVVAWAAFKVVVVVASHPATELARARCTN